MMAAGYKECDFIVGAVAARGEEITVPSDRVEISRDGLSLDCLDPRLPSDV